MTTTPDFSAVDVVVFDVNETLSDMAPLGKRFADVGAPEALVKVWFASLLRDGFALTASGHKPLFGELADGALRAVLAAVEPEQVDEAVRHILAGFADLDVHRDVPEGVRRLRRHGLRLVTLTNGSSQIADRLLSKAGLRNEFERLLSVDDAAAWKPARTAYEYAVHTCGVPADRMLLVAVHPWDIDGARRAGLRTGWINRQRTAYPHYFTEPHLQAPDLATLADEVVAGRHTNRGMLR
jgi:2-haloacid dehalogenase